MLPPPLPPSARPRSLSLSALPSRQARTFFNWRRGRYWDSQVEPSYQRYHYYRNLKERAKLLKSANRRSQFNWDLSLRPLFSPRYASHWPGGRAACRGEHDTKSGNETTKAEHTNDPDQYELNQKEQDWKSQMEATRRGDLWREQVDTMRRRIEDDPYEAVFGKRFEPFWSHWFPREDWGLPPKKAQTPSTQSRALHFSETIPLKTGEAASSRCSSSKAKPANPVASTEYQKSTMNQPSSIGYSSSTSWDSWTNKTQRTEWDLVSGENKRFEYDPVSNRMIPIQQSKPIKASDVKSLTKATPRAVTNKPVAPLTKLVTTSTSIDMPVQTSKETRRAIVVPTGSVVPQISPHMTPAQALARVPSAITQPLTSSKTDPELEGLTANAVRASIGKHRNGAKLESLQTDMERLLRKDRKLQRRLESINRKLGKVGDSHVLEESAATSNAVKASGVSMRASNPLQTSMQRGASGSQTEQMKKLLQPALVRMQTKSRPEPAEFDDAAAHESTEPLALVNLPKGWGEQAELLQTERIRRTSAKIPHPSAAPRTATPRWVAEMFRPERPAEDLAADATRAARLDKARAIHETEVAKQKLAMHLHEDRAKSAVLAQEQVLVEAAASKEVAVIPQIKQAKLAEPLNAPDNQTVSVAYQREERYAQKIRSLRAELEVAYKQSSFHADEFRDQIKKLKISVAEAQGASDAQSTAQIKEKYGQKVRALMSELDTAYKQSAVHGEEFRDQIQKLKIRVAEVQEASKVQLTAKAAQLSSVANRYRQKLQAMAAERDTAYIQSSRHADEFSDRIRKLESELAKATKAATKTTAVVEAACDNMQGEGDFCANVTNWADSSKWYKQPAFQAKGPLAMRSDQKTKDEALVKEVRGAYERRYGIIDTEHRQDSNEARNDALVNHDRKTSYAFKDDGLEAQLRAQNAQHSLPSECEDHSRAQPHRIVSARERLPATEKESLQNAQSSGADGYSERSYDFIADNLEAQLKSGEQSSASAALISSSAKPEVADTNAPSVASASNFQADDLESELKAQASAPLVAPVTFIDDGLEAELKAKSTEQVPYASDAYEAAAANNTASTTPPSANVELTPSSLVADAESKALQWDYPPIYKVLAYDSGNDIMTTATTSSWLTESDEKPLSITHALEQLYQPARFISAFAEMQDQGFQVVHAGKDVLVFKKVKRDVPPTTLVSEETVKPSVVEDVARPVNPVDGMASPREVVRPATGNFASPTGFVNYDPVQDVFKQDLSVRFEQVVAGRDTPATDIITPRRQDGSHQLQEVDDRTEFIDEPLRRDEHESAVRYKHYPRIKREEQVFSGTKRVDRRPWNQRPRRSKTAQQDETPQSSWRKWATVAAVVSAGTSGVYLIGSSRESVSAKERERWARENAVREMREAAERGRWKLDGGFWKKAD